MKTKLMLVAVLSILAVGCGGSDTPSEDVTHEEEVTMKESPVEGVTFRYIETNGIKMRIAEAGKEDGAVVLLVHGWPESWYSWRHQITALADAGYRVVVPEMRGYGKTDAPEDVDSYDIKSLSADMAGVLDAVGAEKATIIGHDWGAIVAANAILFHPDRFSSLVLMSVPYGGRPQESLMTSWNAQYGDKFFYILYHNEEGGVAEAEYDSDPRGFLSRLYLSPDSPREAPTVIDPLRASGGWIPRLGAAKGLPTWLTQDELDYFVAQFEASGFRGGINYYRNFHRNWEITEHLSTAKIEVPTLFVAGQKDMVIGGATAPMLKGLMGSVIPDLKDVVIIPEMGHWIQQEAPKETNEAVLGFLQGL